MSPATGGRRAVQTLLSHTIFAANGFSRFCLAALVLGAGTSGVPLQAQARGGAGGGGGGGHMVPAAARPAFARPLHVSAPVVAPVVQRPAVHPAGQARNFHQGLNRSVHGPRFHNVHHAQNLHGGHQNPHPAFGGGTFVPQATWPQQHFKRRAGLGGVYAPSIIYAPQAAAGYEPPLQAAYAEPPLEQPYYGAGYGQGYHQPCAAPLIINIGAGAQSGAQNGVRVIHAQQSACGTAEVVTYTGPRVLEAGPAAAPVARRGHRHGRQSVKGFKVVRARD